MRLGCTTPFIILSHLGVQLLADIGLETANTGSFVISYEEVKKPG